MKIERMNKGSWGKVRAFFDLTTQEGFTMKGFKLIEGINGLFVSMPSQKGNDEQYYDTIWVESKQLRDELTQLAISEYNNNSTSMEAPQTMETTSDSMENSMPESMTENTEAVGSNLTDSKTEEVAVSKTETFSDDDIPF